MVRPAQRRWLAKWMIEEKAVSQRKACLWVGLSRNAMAEPITVKESHQPLQSRIKQLAKRYKHWGVLKIYHYLGRQGEIINHKRVRRLYRLSGLSLPRKTRKRLVSPYRKRGFAMGVGRWTLPPRV